MKFILCFVQIFVILIYLQTILGNTLERGIFSEFIEAVTYVGEKIINWFNPNEKGSSENNQESTPSIQIQIENGWIRGRFNNTVKGTPYWAFQGIPFAEPPVGPLRFQPPVKKQKWNDIWDATADRSYCVQGFDFVHGNEDCLYINVYVPYSTHSQQQKYTVMVWIYGGAFINGKSNYDEFGPDYFLDEEVIFVSFNYRLGIFGFLSTGDLDCPGNMGLKDQVLALEWVRDNIQHFGGDPRQVTIFGESAGSASVSYLLQSTKTRGLYRSAIMQSGSSLCPWALSRPTGLILSTLANLNNITYTNTRTILNGLRKIHFTRLHVQSLASGFVKTLLNPLHGLPFGPVIEPPHAGAVFSSYSEFFLQQGHFHRIPIMIGVNANEGSTVYGFKPGLAYLLFLLYRCHHDRLAPIDLTNDKHKRTEVGEQIYHRYEGLKEESNIVKFLSDDQFNRPITKMALNMARYSSVYYYQFSYQGQLGLTYIEQPDNGYPGPGHGEEMGFLFKEKSGVPSTHHNANFSSSTSLLEILFDEITPSYLTTPVDPDDHLFMKIVKQIFTIRGVVFSNVIQQLFGTHNERGLVQQITDNMNEWKKWLLYGDKLVDVEADNLTRQRLIKLWTNFAKNGNPTPVNDPLLQNVNWHRVGEFSKNNWFYLDINRNLELKRNPFNETISFYERIYAEFGDPPYDTY